MQETSYSFNGVNIYALPNPNLRSFCLSLYIRAGSFYETDKNNGIGHLFEHVVFRNIKRKHPNFYEESALHGVDLQARTYKEFIQFELNGPSAEFEFAADILFNIFDEIELDRTELDKEKKRVKAEIREGDERSSIYYFFNQLVWKGTEAEKSVLGYCRILDSVSVKKLNEYRKECFSKNNFFIYITGNFSDKDIEILKIKTETLDLPQNEIKRSNTVTLNNDFFNRRIKINIKNDTWYYISAGFDFDNTKYPQGVIDILYGVLFNCDKALMYKYLSEDNPVIYSYDSTQEQYDNVGNIYFKFEVDKTCIEEAIAVVVEMLNDVKVGKFNFEATLCSEKYHIETELDSPSDLNWSLAYYNHILKANSDDPCDKLHTRFESVTKEQVAEAAKDIFCTKNLTVAIKGKKKNIKTENIEEILKKLDC
ncbi:MAG: insulinase family protein [Clostridia bacterium]|nr:insulinase family protein [Clostridia bacterium]